MVIEGGVVMKKIIVAFAALAAAFSLASCSKEQVETPSTGLRLNVKVASIDGSADTKAAKTGWEAGDRINMWFDDWNYTAQTENHIPDMIIRYNGSAWVVESEAEGLDARLKAAGKLSAVYEGFNDLSKYTFQWWNSSEWFRPHRSWHDVETDHRSLIAYTEGTDYAYADDTLTACLDSWLLQTKFKVVVKNDDNMMNSAAENYALQVKNTTNDTYASVTSCFIIGPRSNYPEIFQGSSNYRGIAGGVQESDGIAFYFSSLAATNADIVFTLLESGVKSNLSYSVKGKTVDPGVMTSIAFNHSKFYGASGTTGTAKRTGDIEVKWVQLWENGPKFAEYNVGAANNKAEDYGGYYCWGGSIDKDRNRAYKEGTDALTGNDDMATNFWGSNWRMPTREEFKALLANCDVAWTAVNGVNGRMYTGKGDYASNSVFLPASGFFFINLVQDTGSFGYYWSSKPGDSSRAYQMYFSVTGQDMHDGYREMGNSVRAVLAE